MGRVTTATDQLTERSRTVSGTVHVLLTATTVAVGVVAGVWFAFSAFVLQGFDRAPARDAVVAMQGINRAAVTPAFMLVLFGTAALCVAVAVWGGLHWSDTRGKLAAAAGALYVVGSIGVTSAANVPLNDSLARVDPGSPGVAEAWRSFCDSWLAWNHVRTVTAVAALVLLTVALTHSE